jgi:hypothetical protein
MVVWVGCTDGCMQMASGGRKELATSTGSYQMPPATVLPITPQHMSLQYKQESGAVESSPLLSSERARERRGACDLYQCCLRLSHCMPQCCALSSDDAAPAQPRVTALRATDPSATWSTPASLFDSLSPPGPVERDATARTLCLRYTAVVGLVVALIACGTGELVLRKVVTTK